VAIGNAPTALFHLLNMLEDPACPVDGELTGFYRQLGERLQTHGALVSEARHELLDLGRLLPLYFNLLGSVMSTSLKPAQRRQMAWIARLERWLKYFGPVTAGVGEYGRGANQPVHQWMSMNETREKMRARAAELFEEFDVLLCPVTPTTAIRHAHSLPLHRRRIQVNGKPRAYMDQFCWIAPATLLGLPATSVPLGKTSEGLPFAIQVIGGPGHDHTTLAFARLMEEAGLAGFQPPELKAPAETRLLTNAT